LALDSSLFRSQAILRLEFEEIAEPKEFIGHGITEGRQKIWNLREIRRSDWDFGSFCKTEFKC